MTYEIFVSILYLLFFALDPFVKVSLMSSGRQLKKTKTSVAKNTLAPVYNEAFVFDVPIDRLSDVSLLVRMLDTNTEDGRRPQTKTIGKAIVGPDAQTSIGLHHWNCMMTTPRKPIAQWHPLVKTWDGWLLTDRWCSSRGRHWTEGSILRYSYISINSVEFRQRYNNTYSKGI